MRSTYTKAITAQASLQSKSSRIRDKQKLMLDEFAWVSKLLLLPLLLLLLVAEGCPTSTTADRFRRRTVAANLTHKLPPSSHSSDGNAHGGGGGGTIGGGGMRPEDAQLWLASSNPSSSLNVGDEVGDTEAFDPVRVNDEARDGANSPTFLDRVHRFGRCDSKAQLSYSGRSTRASRNGNGGDIVDLAAGEGGGSPGGARKASMQSYLQR